MRAAKDRQKPIFYRSGVASVKHGATRADFKSRLRIFFSKLLNLLIIVALLAAMIYVLIIRPQPQIILNSQIYNQPAIYHQAAVSEFASWRNRNKLTLNEAKISQDLKSQFPEIASIRIGLTIFSRIPQLRLNISPPSFRLTAKGSDLIVDSQGVVVGKSANLPQLKNLTPINDQSGLDTRIGHQILSSGDISFINNLLAQLKHAKVSLAALSLPAATSEIDLRTTDRNYFVKFFLGGDALIQSGQFLAARHQFDQTNTQPADYLDVRISGKIYYK